MPFTDIVNHKNHYYVLAGIISIHAALLYNFNDNFSPQQIILASAAISYFAWGIIHHARTHHLNTAIVLEYLLLSGLGFLIGRSLLLY